MAWRTDSQSRCWSVWATRHTTGSRSISRNRRRLHGRAAGCGSAMNSIDDRPLLADFLKPLEALGWGVHAKNLYNDYVYFWRWALWKVFENKGGPGIVSFITAASYLRGPGFAGMRQVMRQTFDELWIIDLEGDNLGARKTENVFAIQTPVAIAIGVRYGEPQPETRRRCTTPGSAGPGRKN